MATPSLRATLFPLLRADDGLAATVRVHFLKPVRQPDGWALTTESPGAPGAIALLLDSQHVLEYAAGPGGTRPVQAKPIYGPGSRLVFVVPAGSLIPLSVAGILGALPGLPLLVDDAAGEILAIDDPVLPAGGGVAAQRAARAAAHDAGIEALLDAAVTLGGAPPPLGTVDRTEIVVPARLRWTPGGGATRFVHSAVPAEREGRVERWHSRLAVHTKTQANPPREVDTYVVGLGAVSSSGNDPSWAEAISDEKLKNPVTAAVAGQLTDQSTKPRGSLVLRRLAVSPGGATYEAHGTWDSGSPKLYRHLAVHGRDDSVRVVERGFLYPFGHRATLTTTVQRQPDSNVNGSAAGLVSTAHLNVLKTVQTYGDGDRDGRLFPWRSVEIRNPVSPLGVKVQEGAGSYLKVDGEAFRSACVAVDRADHVITFELPLLFVPDGTGVFAADAAWRNLGTEFTHLPLGRQPVAAAPAPAGGSGAVAGGGEPGNADVTTILTDLARLGGSFDATNPAGFRPIVFSFDGVVAALSGVEGPVARTVTVAEAYLSSGFGPGNAGELLYTFAGPVVQLGQGAEGLAAPVYQIAGLSRRVGAVADDLVEIAKGNFKPQQWLKNALTATLFGVFPLKDLLPANLDLGKAPRQLTEAIDGLTSHVTTWDVDLLAPGQKRPVPGATLSAPATAPVRLSLRNETTADPVSGTIRSRTVCEITDAIISVNLGGKDLVSLPVPVLRFESVNGRAPTMDLGLGAVSFDGPLKFVETLANLLHQFGTGQRAAGALAAAPSGGPVELLSDRVRASLVLAVPDLAVGMFSLQDLVLSTRFDLFFDGRPPELGIDFATFENPFGLTVSMLGGGGFLSLVLSPKGLQSLAGALEFGASATIDLKVARGCVSVTGGVYFEIGTTGATLTGFLRVRGHLDVLGIVSVTVELLLALSYVSATKKIEGEAELAVKVKVFCFHKTVRLHMKRQFAGANSDPSFAELMAPADAHGVRGWDTYCTAFADEPIPA
jgi:hypothetical protein